MRNSIKVSMLGLAGLIFAAAATPAAAGSFRYDDTGHYGGTKVVSIVYGRHGQRIKRITTYDGHGHKVRVVHQTRRGRTVVWQHPRMRKHLHKHRRHARHDRRNHYYQWDPATRLALRIIDRALDSDRHENDRHRNWNRADRYERERQARIDRQANRDRHVRRDRRRDYNNHE